MRSLRFKFIFALLVTSVVSVAATGFTARSILLQQFGDLKREEAFQRFRGDVAAYFYTYGTWEKGARTEDFHEFIHRRRDAEGFAGAAPQEGFSSRLLPANAALPPAPAGGGMFPGDPLDGLPDGMAGGPPPPGMGMSEGLGPGGRGPGGPGGPDSPGGPGGPGAGGPGPGGPGPSYGPDPGAPASPADTLRRAPFRFLAFSSDGRILTGDEQYTPGSQAPPELRAAALPVVYKGKTVAFAVPVQNPNLSPLDQRYLDSINRAISYAVLPACALALGLGVLFGSQLCGELRRLATALRAVGGGEVAQQIQLRSRDEVGQLGEAFNRMSAELARTHAELRQSTEEVRAQAELLREQSIRDPLTQVYNRRHFNEQATVLYAQATRYRHPLSVMICDVDHFKRINDQFSHAVGDEVLRRLAAILQHGTRQSDVAARYGGEEFVVAFYQTPLPIATELCERLRRQVEAHPWREIHPDLHVTMSIGVCDDLALGSFEAMVAEADRHLYRAKDAGRNRVCSVASAANASGPQRLPAPSASQS